MNLWILIWNYLRSKPLNTALNILLLSLGIAVMSILILFSRQFHEQVESNSRGIDLVVGAKGSPMQLILCNIFHIDFPTGNINLQEAETIARHRLVKRAVPLALGDSYEGFRIVGTTHAYLELYNAKVARGSLWQEPMEVILGSVVATALKLKEGARFSSNHGLSQSGHSHDEQQFVVTGVLEKTNSVLDNLILTGVESVWKVHESHAESQVPGNAAIPAEISSVTSPLVPSTIAGDSTKEITSMLIQYRSPMGAIQLPRWVNSKSRMQAASPAFETARLFSIMGVGLDVLRAFAYILVFISSLSIFIALYNSLKERRYDLAIMRSMGATKWKIFATVLMEGVAMTLSGSVLGIALAHTVIVVFSALVAEGQMAGISGFVFYAEEGIILAGGLLLGILCALLPAWQAYRTDISKVLATG